MCVCVSVWDKERPSESHLSAAVCTEARGGTTDTHCLHAPVHLEKGTRRTHTHRTRAHRTQPRTLTCWRPATLYMYNWLINNLWQWWSYWLSGVIKIHVTSQKSNNQIMEMLWIINKHRVKQSSFHVKSQLITETASILYMYTYIHIYFQISIFPFQLQRSSLTRLQKPKQVSINLHI